MAAKLILKQFGGPEIASVYQSPDGKYSIEVLAAGLQAEIYELVGQMSQKSFLLTGGFARKQDQAIVNITTSREVAPGDPDYLSALADALSDPTCKVQGKRVRAYLVKSD